MSSTVKEQASLWFQSYYGVIFSSINLVGWAFYPQFYNTVYTDFYPPARGV